MNQTSCAPCGTETAAAPAAKAATTFRPRIEILSQGGGEVLHAELPGVKQENLELRVEGEHLYLRATFEHEAKDRGYLLREYGSGNFERRFRLSPQLDTTAITAEFADGILTLRMPRKQEAQPRRIEISPRSA